MISALAKTALRNFRRRPGQTALVTSGLLVASLVLAAALVAGDSMERLFLENVYASWGTVDVQVGTVSGRGFGETVARGILGDSKVASLSDGGTVRLQMSSAAEAPLASRRERRVNLIGLDPLLDPSLGPLAPQENAFPLDGFTYVNTRLSNAIGLDVGDPLELKGVTPQGTPFDVTVVVSGVLPDAGLADWERTPNAFVPLGFLQRSTGTQGLINQVLISAKGSGRSPEKAGALGAAAAAAAERLSPSEGLGIADSKAEELDAARENTLFFRSILTLLGSIVAAASTALIVNLFIMLGEERRTELGTMRAFGLRRSGVVGLGLSEGTLYATVAGIIGAFAGVFVGRYLGEAMSDLFAQFTSAAAVELSVPPFEVSVVRLISAATGGFLISTISVLFVSYRTSRMTVVAAIRGLPDERIRRRRRLPVWQSLVALTGGAMLFGGAIPQGVGGMLIALGVGGFIAKYVNRRLGASVGALAALGWGLYAHAAIDPGFDETPGTAFGFLGVVGISTVLAGVVLFSTNLSLLTGLVRPLGSRTRAVLRTATGYAAGYPMRTGLSVAMFALVLYMIAGFAIWGGFALGDFEEQSGGFEVFGVATLPLPEPPAAAGAQDVVSLYAARYTLGYQVGERRETQFPIVLYGVDEHFARINEFKLRTKPAGLSDREVWTRLIEEPDWVVMESGILPPGDVKVGELVAVTTDDGLRTMRLLGVADQFLFSAVFMSKATFDDFFPTRAADTAWMISVKPGSSPAKVASEIEAAHADAGMDARPLEEIFDEIASGQQTFVGLFQILLKLGLVIGISGLAIASVRTVLERRHAVGVLRALGFQRWMVAMWLMVESLTVATIGVAVGLGVGLLGTYLIVTVQIEGFAFSADWSQVGSALLILYGAVALFTLIPAVRAARLRPAEAVRYVE